MTSVIILFVCIILGSNLCSLIESAILSLPLIRARILVEQGRKHAKDLLYIKEHISLVIPSIVIINNAINIVGSIFIGEQISLKFGHQWLGVVSAVLTLTIIIFGEIIPKIIGERYKIPISLFIAQPLRILLWILSPIVNIVLILSRPILRDSHLPKVTEEEIKIMLQLGRAAGTVEMDEEVLCNRIFKLNDLRTVQIMKPITEVNVLPADKTLEDVKESIINCPFSRIVIYDKTITNVVGVAQQRILLREIARDNYKVQVQDFMSKPIFVDAMMKADSLLEKFQAYHQHLFIVQDASKKVIGVVAMEDVLEELFGEIYDEKDMLGGKRNPHRH